MGTQQTIYVFDKSDFTYQYTYDAQPDPLNPGYFLYPNDVTIVAPPPLLNDHSIQVWSAVENSWTIVDDYRNIPVWRIADGVRVTMTLGESLTAELTINYDDVNESVRRIPYEISIKASILSYLDFICEQGTSYLDTTFQAREEDVNRVSLMIMKVDIGGEFFGYWRDRLNNWVPITFEQLKGLGLVIGNYWQSKFVKSRQLIDQLPSLSLAELINYNVADRFNS